MRFRASFASFLHIGDVEILEVELTDLIDAYLQCLVAIDLITHPSMHPSQNSRPLFHLENQVGD